MADHYHDINNRNTVKFPINFKKYPSFIGLKFTKEKYYKKVFFNLEKFKSQTEEMQFNRISKNGYIFGSVDDMTLGLALYQYYKATNTNDGECMWPFMRIPKWMFPLIVNRDAFFSDKTIPIMLPRDIMRLHTILGFIKEPKSRVNFLHKFMKFNFEGKKKEALYNWGIKNKYIVDPLKPNVTNI
jgi:hypothetical protein